MAGVDIRGATLRSLVDEGQWEAARAYALEVIRSGYNDDEFGPLAADVLSGRGAGRPRGGWRHYVHAIGAEWEYLAETGMGEKEIVEGLMEGGPDWPAMSASSVRRAIRAWKDYRTAIAEAERD